MNCYTHGYKERGYLCVNAWKKKGMVPKSGEKPERLWSNSFCNGVYDYYLPEQMRLMNAEENALEAQIRSKKNKIRYQRECARKKAMYEEFEQTKKELEHANEQLRTKLLELLSIQKNNCAQMERASTDSILPDSIVIDVETTGLSSIYDELLQISIIAESGEHIFNSYVKPYCHSTWEESGQIHGIKPEDVSNAPYMHEITPILKSILENANVIIGYNVSFDLDFLKGYGICPHEDVQIQDVMRLYASKHGAWSDYYQDYEWVSLSTCASRYSYDFQAHNSLSDCEATLYIYHQLQCEIIV